MQSFHHLLANNFVANLTNFTVWFALTFWTFLETGSVFATGMIAGIYLGLTALLGVWFGSLVDHRGKRNMMLASSLASLFLYALVLTAYVLLPDIRTASVSSATFWLFILLSMLAVICGNIRMIALPTLVTLLIAEDRRDKANGLVGMVGGVGFLVTSAISGFLVAWGGMIATLVFAIAFTLAAAVHLLFVRIDEPRSAAGDHEAARRVDLAGTFRVILGIPGLLALILFATFNNFLGGVYMALMDAYGLSLMKVEQWGLLWAVLSCAFILSGALISRTGLGANPIRTLLFVCLIEWAVAAIFTIQSSIPLLAIGCFVWMFLGPYAEAAEQTALQKVVPFERQGRVFGFAQSIEQAASPLTAFLIAPITQFFFVPMMTEGIGADAIGDWYGRGPERGIAIVFSIAGVLGMLATIAAFRSKSYGRISDAYFAGATGGLDAPAKQPA
ncbi:MFS transporter [Sphingopyxis sp. H115]|uniref:MFS transporter n=1 Tax=Sphingopyxis sp. H115 TaxID=1759073 RepID=UPI0007362AA5|nr:MFS transporter [Sphingopyxis sp. H115]KTE15492.1 multidrug transporter [Sphingopyxis sp. H115]